MQSKGFVKVISVLLVLICAFYLSFSLVTNSIESDADAYAKKGAKTEDVSNATYKSLYKAYLDSMAKEKVYLGYTFQQTREQEVGLGLDLKGGMNVTLQISVPAVINSLSGYSEDPKFKEALKATDDLLHQGKVDKEIVKAFCEQYQKINPNGSLAQVFRNVEAIKKNPNATNAEVEKILKEQVQAMIDNSYNVLRTRIDRFGVVAPNIQKLEREGQIQLELPGIKEPERVRKLLQGSANLEFYETVEANTLVNILAPLSGTVEVAQEATPAVANDSVATAQATASDSVTAPTEQAKPAVAQNAPATKKEDKAVTLGSLIQFQPQGCIVGFVAVSDTATVNRILASSEAKANIPSNVRLCWTVKAIDDAGKYFQLISLKTNAGKPALAGDVVEDASAEFDHNHRSVVSMSMNDEGARKWARITAANIGKSVAIVLDDQVYSFPTVNTAIEGGRSEISGNFTVEEAKDLANVLKSGKMAAKVEIVSEGVIGPSLGQQAIESGFISFIVALVLLAVFMIAIYGFGPGMIANICLVFNLFFMMGILASIHAVLTLSGICGIVLSLGMAVDANVLIYERTKEELRAGKGLRAAIADGYSNAFSAIFDSNLTSILTAIVLLYFGSGPIKGFATTLIIGIVCSFFTAVFMSRVIIESLVASGKWKNTTFSTKLSKDLWTKSNFDFLGKRKFGYGVIAVAIIIVIASLSIRKLNPGIDFSGGRNYIVQFDHAVNTNQMENDLQQYFGDATIKVITIDNATRVRISTNYKINEPSENQVIDDEIMDILYKGLKSELNGMSREDFSTANENVGVVSTEKVGPSIAKDITTGAIWAVLISLLAMFLYILIRFRNVAFSLGALAAVAFTAFMIIGLYSLLYGILPFPMEIDQQFIAAILTVIGYQVNDTVVVFDRVRENHSLYPKKDWLSTFNESLNSTLTRTIMTSFSTFLVLIVIFILGGETIRSFTFAMLCGVVIGTLASLFIASPVAYAVTRERKHTSK